MFVVDEEHEKLTQRLCKESNGRFFLFEGRLFELMQLPRHLRFGASLRLPIDGMKKNGL
jgi:hypothetical protein